MEEGGVAMFLAVMTVLLISAAFYLLYLAARGGDFTTHLIVIGAILFIFMSFAAIRGVTR